MTRYLERIKADLLFSRGVRRAEDGDFDGALRIFTEVAKRVPDMALAHANSGFCLYRLGKATEAIAAYERARALAPEDPQHAHDIGCVFYTSGQKEKALDCFLEALKSEPGHKEAYAAMEKIRAELKIPANDPRLAAVLPAVPPPAESPKPPPAPTNAKAPSAPEAAPPPKAAPASAPESQPDVIAALLTKGYELFEQGEHDAALSAWSKVASMDPTNATVHNNRAAVLFELGRHQEAIEACSEALRIQPGYAVAHMTRGEIFAAMGNRDAVMREYTALNAIDEELAQQLIDLVREMREHPE